MPVDTNVGTNGLVARGLATVPAKGDGMLVRPRRDRRGEAYTANLSNGLQAVAEEGSYYSLTAQGTIDTGINMTVGTGTTYGNTQAMLVIFNADPPGGRNFLLDYFTILQLTVITGGTTWSVMHALDNGNRYSSGGTAMTLNAFNGMGLGPGNISAAVGNSANIVAYAGAVVATAATANVQLLHRTQILNGVGVARMTLNVKYGGQDMQSSFNTPTTTQANIVYVAPAIVIPPQMSYVLYEWQAGRSATGTAEFYGGGTFR